MKFKVNPKIFDDFDNPRIALIVVSGADNAVETSGLEQQTSQIVESIREKFSSETLSQQPKIAAWRDAFRQFGVKAKDYPSSIEALYKRILRGQDLGTINPLVDIYNYISLKYMLPVGGEDLDAMQGDFELTYATDNEVPVTVLGKDEAQAPRPGEVLYKDDLGAICRRWCWREVARTILTEHTKNCVLVLEAIGPFADTDLTQAQDELARLVAQYCHSETKSFVLDKQTPSVSV